MVIHRGEIWWADLEDAVGSSPAYRRPVLIVQDDLLNELPIRTVIVLPITSNLTSAKRITNVLLPESATGLPKDSVAVAQQIDTIDRARLLDRVGSLSTRLMEEVDYALACTLGLLPG